MSSVDDRIVNMQFNSTQFQKGAGDAQKSLADTETAMQNLAKNPGLNDTGKQVDGLASKFSALQIAGVTAVATIANKAVEAGLQFLKGFTIGPLIDGFNEYQTTLTSTQTVMANTGAGVKEVNDQLDILNAFSDQTIYNFGQMAKNVGTFTAAGVGLKESVSAIKGISNLAALSGSSAQQASTAMYQLSQAIAAGRVNLQDWNSVVNAGMGGKNFQTALAITGNAMGTVADSALDMDKNFKLVKISGQSFRESISAAGKGASWLTSDVLTKTLSLLDGRLSKTAIAANHLHWSNKQVNDELERQQALLAKQGYNKQQIQALTDMADAAFKSATQIKTFPQLVSVVKESIGSIWASFFRGLLGNFTQSVNLWTSVGNVIQSGTLKINRYLTSMADAWNKVRSGLGGRYDFIDALSQGFHNIGRILAEIGKAWRDVFPPSGVKPLMAFTQGFITLVHAFHANGKDLDNIRKTFAGLFAILHIGFTVVKLIAGAFFAFIGAISPATGAASSGLLEFTGHLGDMLVAFDKFLTSGGRMVDFFGQIGAAAGGLAAKGLGMASDLIMGLVNGLVGGEQFQQLKAAVINLGTSILNWIKDELGIHSPSKEMADVGKNAVEGLVNGLISGVGYVAKAVGLLIAAIINGFHGLFSGLDALDVASVLNAIFAGALILTLRRFAQGFSQIGTGIYNVLNQLQGTLKTMQNTLRAEALRALAVSIAILVGAVLLLQYIKPDKVKTGVAAIGALITMMTVSLKSLSNIGKDDKGFKTMAGQSARITALATAFTAMATAVAILSAAVVLLGKQDMKTLEKGLGSVGILMAFMTTSLSTLAKAGPSVKGAAAAITAMAVALDLLTVPIILLGHQNLKVLVKGLGSVAIIMTVMTASLGTLAKAGPSVEGAAAAILAMGAAMVLMAKSVSILGNLSLKDLIKGIVALGAGLVGMSTALVVVGSMGPEAQAAGLAFLALGAGLILFAKAVSILGNLSLGELAKGLGALIIGIVALLAVAVIGAEAIPFLMALGVALALIGGAVFLAGAGVALFAAGLAILATVGAAAIGVMVAAIDAFIALLPSIAVQMAAAFVSLLETLAKAAPQIRAAMTKIIEAILGAVGDANEAIAKLFQRLVDTALKVLVHNAKAFGEAGFQMIDNFITSARNHVPHIVGQAIALVTDFLDAISQRLPKLADSAAKMIIAFINGIADAINNNADDLRNAGLNMALAIANGLSGGLLGDGLRIVKKAAEDLADKLPGWMRKILHIKSPSRVMMEVGYNVAAGLAQGIISHTTLAVQAVRNMANAILIEGNKALLAVQRQASKAQRAADAAKARADATRRAAAAIAKTDPTRSKQLKARADAEQKIAEQLQARADSAVSRVDRAKEFANADIHTKGDIRNADAVRQSEAASRMLAKARAEAAEAAELAKTNRAAGLAMLRQAQKDAKEAQHLAALAKASHQAALKYYAQEVNARIKLLEQTRADEAKAKADQAAFDAADTQGKIDILKQRQIADQAKADAAAQKAAALIQQAKALAATDATRAMKLLDQAEAQAQIAKDAADAAQQDKDQISQLMGQAPGGTVTDYTPSKSVLEDAAKSFDRYTLSLQAAEAAAAATPQPMQFVQNNYSPESISASDAYRLTNNLLSQAEDKLAVKPS